MRVVADWEWRITPKKDFGAPPETLTKISPNLTKATFMLRLRRPCGSIARTGDSALAEHR
jgi:hypothetical protein